MHYRLNKGWFIMLSLWVLFLLSSCFSARRTQYINVYDTLTVENQYLVNDSKYRIRSADILYIDIQTYNEELNTFFQRKNRTITDGGNNNTGRSSNANYFSGYAVNDSGFVYIPILGAIELMGLTINQANSKLNQLVGRKMEGAYVDVKLLNYRISFLGEINLRGTVNFYSERVSVLEALAYAGDLTDYADRRNVLLIRQTHNGSRTIVLDLTTPDILASEYYYLQPDDILIAQPRKIKVIRRDLSDYSTLITAITTIVTTTLLIINLRQTP